MLLLQYFRTISFLEGLTLVGLLFVAIPLRNFLEMYSAVTFAGTLHGFMFLSYFFISLVASHFGKWSVKFWLLTLITSILPFAFLYMDRQLHKREMQYALAKSE